MFLFLCASSAVSNESRTSGIANKAMTVTLTASRAGGIVIRVTAGMTVGAVAGM